MNPSEPDKGWVHQYFSSGNAHTNMDLIAQHIQHIWLNEISLIDILGTEANEVEDKVQLKIEKNKIYQHIHILDDREKEVIIGRFGLDNEEERTQREIARELGISRSYVSRIEKRALLKLFHEFYRKNENAVKN
ncbi:sigma-70 family RNA polymerase sigma factor [Aneurinibacillus thermoaerophilus]|uniref:RNA polymerase sigma factor, sigma-70 family n=2 Tax=Aneurinibacillus thermoaerophilus TaxID=143495 RepID=A0A1G8CZR7_ANETH|nr:sigma-70 family RNA polymerase sigma factor [Aneurinibacillus thermoaerophilus]MED0758456.1 sigma-70 family RNA polymerase sigma factor [Aneurinibacillus thermoaerophilus]MED0762543.1 sigma-70 family RNA polymerase sigma factor [Aneurinibacillus thermoaerophilus]SDH50629.1 RNA polymerase sigma factor, sigma-70 family [Aneurinibacillus thermoaerophilus]